MSRTGANTCHNLGQPNIASLTLTRNRWLKAHDQPTRLLAVDHHGESMILLITDRKIDSNATCSLAPTSRDLNRLSMLFESKQRWKLNLKISLLS